MEKASELHLCLDNETFCAYVLTHLVGFVCAHVLSPPVFKILKSEMKKFKLHHCLLNYDKTCLHKKHTQSTLG